MNIDLIRSYIAFVKDIDSKIENNYDQQIRLILEKIKAKNDPKLLAAEWTIIGDLLTRELGK